MTKTDTKPDKEVCLRCEGIGTVCAYCGESVSSCQCLALSITRCPVCKGNARWLK